MFHLQFKLKRLCSAGYASHWVAVVPTTGTTGLPLSVENTHKHLPAYNAVHFSTRRFNPVIVSISWTLQRQFLQVIHASSIQSSLCVTYSRSELSSSHRWALRMCVIPGVQDFSASVFSLDPCLSPSLRQEDQRLDKHYTTMHFLVSQQWETLVKQYFIKSASKALFISLTCERRSGRSISLENNVMFLTCRASSIVGATISKLSSL